VLFLRCKPLGFGSVALHDKGPRGSAARWVPFRGHRIACCRKRAREGDRDKPEAKREYRNEQQSKKPEREAFSLRSGTTPRSGRGALANNRVSGDRRVICLPLCQKYV